LCKAKSLDWFLFETYAGGDLIFAMEVDTNVTNRLVKDETPLFYYWDEFVEHYLREGKSEETVKNVRDVLKFVITGLGITTIEDCCNPAILREALFKAKIARRWGNVTFNSYVKNINTYFIWLEDMEYILENKIRKVRKCKEELNEQYTLSEEQIGLIFAHMKTRRQTRLERWRNDFFISLLSVTGARPCELLQLQVRDVVVIGDTYKIVIHGRKQKGRLRYYRFPSWLRDTYEAYENVRSKLRSNEISLFISSSKRTGWTAKGMRGLFRSLSKELGFKVIAYGFRRFVATKLNKEGLSLQDIQNHLGHTRASTTLRYIERSCMLTDKGMKTMSGVIGS